MLRIWRIFKIQNFKGFFQRHFIQSEKILSKRFTYGQWLEKQFTRFADGVDRENSWDGSGCQFGI